MKRDMNLVREILLALEADTERGLIDLTIDGFSVDEVSYHVKIMAEAHLLEAIDASSHDGDDWRAAGLTWQGHEFFDAVRNDTVWRKTKQLIAEKGGAIPFEILKGLVMKIATSSFESAS